MSKYTDLMIDVETLGLEPRSVVREIGAVAFSAKADTFEPVGISIMLDPQEQIDFGRTVRWETIQFWLHQPPLARKMFAGDPLGERGDSLNAGLTKLFDFWEENFVVKGDETLDTCERVWAHGPQFDLVMVESLIHDVAGRPPWKYRSARDTRTLADMVADVDKPEPEIEHSGLHDALAQAEWVWKMYQRKAT